jgi:hypothetical protein
MTMHAEYPKTVAQPRSSASGIATPPGGSAAAAWATFEAPTAEGTVRLSAPGTVRHAADAAVALQACAPLLDALDQWFGFAPAWRWCAPGTPATSNGAAHARATWHGEATTPAMPAVTCRIELPWPLLRQLDAPPAPLAAQLHWSAAPATLVLAQMSLDDVELDMMEPGGAVLLPCSMVTPWLGWLRAADEDATAGSGLPVALAEPWQARALPPAERAAPPESNDATLVEVRLALPCPLIAAQLAGWINIDRADPEARASLWRCAGGGARYLASGALMPWGDGWALHLETLAD